MDRRKVSLAPVIVVLTLLAITCVTAHSLISNTPLYTLRMEEASNKMNFLPTAMNEFTYLTEEGYKVNHEVSGFCSTEPLDHCTSFYTTCGVTCPSICEPTSDTCNGYTCDDTSCQSTCDTCLDTCPYTCWSSCSTCSTCAGGGYTCDGPCIIP
jgi:hypothetical protein